MKNNGTPALSPAPGPAPEPAPAPQAFSGSIPINPSIPDKDTSKPDTLNNNLDQE